MKLLLTKVSLLTTTIGHDSSSELEEETQAGPVDTQSNTTWQATRLTRWHRRPLQRVKVTSRVMEDLHFTNWNFYRLHFSFFISPKSKSFSSSFRYCHIHEKVGVDASRNYLVFTSIFVVLLQNDSKCCIPLHSQYAQAPCEKRYFVLHVTRSVVCLYKMHQTLECSLCRFFKSPTGQSTCTSTDGHETIIQVFPQ